jgi:ferredoxin
MAHLSQKRTENMSGDFYVDSTCIDCDTCRWMAPEVFHRDSDQSAVFHQPANPNERLRALQALLSCPTASIGTLEPPKDIRGCLRSQSLCQTPDHNANHGHLNHRLRSFR